MRCTDKEKKKEKQMRPDLGIYYNNCQCVFFKAFFYRVYVALNNLANVARFFFPQCSFSVIFFIFITTKCG
jgi:hypothetical protein